MEIHIQKGTTVSLHQQLVTQLSMQIASGLLRPGTKLPSIRALSKKLDIHYNTCLFAYRQLARIGLIDLRHGSGARVKVLDTDQPKLPEQTSLETLAEFFAEQALRQGYTWPEAQKILQGAFQKFNAQALSQIVFVDIHADILPAFQTELETALSRPVRTSLIEQLDMEKEKNTHFVVSRYHYQALVKKLKEAGYTKQAVSEGITMIEVGSGRQELKMVLQLPVGTLIGIVSRSTTILHQAEAVIRAVRGDDILVRTVLVGDEPLREIRQIASVAKVVFTDASFKEALSACKPKRLEVIKVIPAEELQKLEVFRQA